MKETKKITDNHAIFVDFALFWVIFGWLALASALLDFFYVWTFVAYFLAAGGYFTWTLIKKRRVLRFSVDFVIANLFTLLAVFIFSFFVTPTVFTGRDQGSFSNAAINLAQNHELQFSTAASREFFSAYGPGKALNFPGFHYTENGNLTTQFPLGYISWLASFYSIFGIYGLVLGNAVCLFLFLMSLYIIGKKLLKIRYAVLLLAFSLTSFSFVWFFKFTLSENLALALLWTMILSILYLKKNPDNKALLLYALSSSLLVFTRIEGYAFFATGLLVVLSDNGIRELIKKNKKYVAFFLAIFLTALAVNFQKDLPFFKEIAKVIKNYLPGTAGANTDEPSPSIVSASIRMLQIHTLYGLTLFLIFGALGMAKSFFDKSKIVLIPLFVAFPSIIYIVDSNISSDHPWMLRRFAFAVLPLFIFYATYLLKSMLEKTPRTARHPNLHRGLAVSITILVLFLNLKSFTRYAFYSEEQGLLEQTRDLSSKFSENDLILVDRLASENGWSMITGPMGTLFGKQAVYFFNVDDISKIDLSKFSNTYLITPKENIPHYASTAIGDALEVVDKYTLTTTRLVEPTKKSLFPILRYPEKETLTVEGYILRLEEK